MAGSLTSLLFSITEELLEDRLKEGVTVLGVFAANKHFL